MAKRYQRQNQKPYIKGQSMQWPKDTKGITRSRISIRWSKEKRTKGQTMNDLQNTRQKTKDQATRTPLGWGGRLRRGYKSLRQALGVD